MSKISSTKFVCDVGNSCLFQKPCMLSSWNTRGTDWENKFRERLFTAAKIIRIIGISGVFSAFTFIPFMIAENVYLELCVCWAIFQLHWNMMKADSVFFLAAAAEKRGHSTLNGMKPFLKRFAPCCNFFAYLHLLLTAWNQKKKNTQVTLYTLLHFKFHHPTKTFFRETSKRAYSWNQTNLFHTLSYSMSLIEYFSSFWQLWVSEKMHKIENMLISHL